MLRRSTPIRHATLLAFASLVWIAAFPAARASTRTKDVSFRGVRIEVPSDWPVYDLRSDPRRCVRYDTHAVYLGAKQADALCPSRLVGRTETVQLEPLESAPPTATLARQQRRLNGETVRVHPTGVDGDTVIAFPRAKVALTATFGTDRALAERIVSSASVGDVSSASDTPAAAPAATAEAAAVDNQPAPLQPAVFQGKGFEACTNPSLDTMRAWLASPYRAIGIYMGGVNRGCSQTLSASWVASAARIGWSFIPTYVGLQAPCSGYSNRINPATAFDQGKAAGSDAMSQADLLGLPTGSPIYFDMESFTYSNTTCRKGVQDFLNGWSRQLQHNGYLSGVYGSAGSTMRSLVDVYNNSAYRRPNAIWNARWNDAATVWGEPEIPDTYWSNHQRIHQYHGGHQERYGGVTINIDNDFLDSSVVRWASVQRWLQGDVSGDGKGDLIHLCCRDYLNTWFSNGDGTYGVKSFRPWPLYALQAGRWLVADISGDGKADLVHLCCSDYANIWTSNGDGTYAMSSVRPWAGYGIGRGSWRVGDLNGDGKTDLMHFCCGDYAVMWLSRGDGTFTFVKVRPWIGYAIQSGSWQSGDLNGDGKTDLVHLCCSDYANVWLSRGDGTFIVSKFRPAAGYRIQAGTWQAGDFNGDGRTDLAHLCCRDYANTWLARTDGTFDVYQFRPWPGYALQQGSWLAADVTGDGKTDLVHVCCPGYINTWTSLGPGTYAVGGFAPWPGYGVQSGSWRSLDLNGDAKGDLVHMCCSTYLNTWLSQGGGTYALTSSPI